MRRLLGVVIVIFLSTGAVVCQSDIDVDWFLHKHVMIRDKVTIQKVINALDHMMEERDSALIDSVEIIDAWRQDGLGGINDLVVVYSDYPATYRIDGIPEELRNEMKFWDPQNNQEFAYDVNASFQDLYASDLTCLVQRLVDATRRTYSSDEEISFLVQRDSDLGYQVRVWNYDESSFLKQTGGCLDSYVSGSGAVDLLIAETYNTEWQYDTLKLDLIVIEHSRSDSIFYGIPTQQQRQPIIEAE